MVLGRSGLVQGDILGELEADIGLLSVGGRGESGTFHRLASSGRSSSQSLYSASSSFIDFRLGCHEPRLVGGFFKGIGVGAGLVGWTGLDMRLETDGAVFGELGEGERDRLRLLMAVIASDGVDGLRKPLLTGAPFGRLSECAAPWPFTVICSLGYGILFPVFVSSRIVTMPGPSLLAPLMGAAAFRGKGRNGFSMPSICCVNGCLSSSRPMSSK